MKATPSSFTSRFFTGVYLVAWVLYGGLFGLITYNRNTGDALGLYTGLAGDVGEFAVLTSLVLIPTLSIILLFRLRKCSSFRLVELALAVSTWFCFLYNLSFVRS